MDRLAQLVHDVVGNIDNVIYRPDPNSQKSFLNPIRRIFDFDVFDKYGGKSRAKFEIYLGIKITNLPFELQGRSLNRRKGSFKIKLGQDCGCLTGNSID